MCLCLSVCVQIRAFEMSYCIDSMGHTNGGNVEIGPCHRMGGNQVKKHVVCLWFCVEPGR